MDPRLSICLPVYNQSALLEWNLNNLIQCPLKDTEIVVQDNCSTENIEGLVLSFNDSRIRYNRNPENLGHDRSIIQAFRNSRSKFAFLLRTSDTVYPEKIEEIIRFTDKNPQVGYCRFSCKDENGRMRLKFPDRTYPKGKEAAQAAGSLWMHPSGELYNLSCFTEDDWDCFDQYMVQEFSHPYRFVVDTMMRMKLSTVADLATGSAVIWQYTYTVNRKDQAETGSKDRKCVYAPEYLYDRYRCEMHYVLREIDSEDKGILIDNLIGQYSKAAVFTFKYLNRNKAMQNHYRYEEIPFSSREELKRFREVTSGLAEEAEEPYRSQILRKLSGIGEPVLVKWYMERLGQAACSRIRKIGSN